MFDVTLSCVCTTCNGFFGRTLEWPMRNSSVEGVLRLQFGLGKGEIGNIGTKDIEFKVAESPDWIGARVVLRMNKQGSSYIDVLPQVGARRNPTEEWTWYLEKDLNAAFSATYPKGSEFRIVGCKGDYDRLEKRLRRACPTFQKGGTCTAPIGRDGKVGIKFESEFNSVVRRCLAKIAFNYMTYAAGPGFALRPGFDKVRSFILRGTGPSEGIVYLRNKPIVAQELLGGIRVTDGHLIVLEAKPDQRKVEVLLSLFNSLRYRIVLSSGYSGLWFAKGHHFDIASGEVSELAPTPELVTV
ncbi:MAG: hypothetical protein WBM04_15895 [Candidatus Korobacteraceae bacterium]